MSEYVNLLAATDAILGELPMSTDGTGHVAACGWDDEQQQCGCYTLRERIESHLATARAEGWDAAVASLEYEDGTPVEALVNRNPFRPTRGAR